MSNSPCINKLWAMEFYESKAYDGSRTGYSLVTKNNIKCMISSYLKLKCTNNIIEHEALMLGSPRTLNLNMVSLKIVLHSTNVVDTFKNITINEGKHDQSLKTAVEGKKGDHIPEGLGSIKNSMIYRTLVKDQETAEPTSPSLRTNKEMWGPITI